jgi:hypothetical protein
LRAVVIPPKASIHFPELSEHLTNEDHSCLARLPREAIETERDSAVVARACWKKFLAKLGPDAAPGIKRYPPPQPSALAKSSGGSNANAFH